MDQLDATQPTRRQGHHYNERTRPNLVPARRRRRISGPVLLVGVLLGLLVSLYLFAPLRTNILIMGLDRAPEGSDVARSDTMILTTFLPARPYVGALSIPRDLWVVLPDTSHNRINTAHYFAEAAQPGSGPGAAQQVVEANFGVDVDYTVRVRFTTLVDVVDALGGVEIDLDQPTALYSAGRHILNGEQALAFVRDRQASDDFSRMYRGQLFLKALIRRTMRPTAWPRLPVAGLKLWQGIDSDVPVWQWPRLAVCLLRVGPDGIDARTLDRNTVRGFTTATGAQVLEPNWLQINPILMEMFGQ